MKKATLIIAALLMASGPAGAQEGKRLLTMEEAVLGTGLAVQRIYPEWASDSKSFHYTQSGQTTNTIFVSNGKKTTEKITVPSSGNPGTVSKRYYVTLKDGNIYYSTDGKEQIAITSYTEPGIVCGESVSRNEFGINGGIFISPDSSKIAFYKKDESRVTLFPLLDITTRTGTLREIRYPMNGMESEFVSLGVYDISTKKTVWMDVTDFDAERYLTNITWGPASDRIYIQVLDRAQKHMHLNEYDATTGRFLRTLLTEENSRFVEPQWPLRFIEGDADSFIYQTDNRTGYKELFLCSLKGGEPKRLTRLDADCEYLTQRGRYIFYYSAAVSPVERHLYRTDIKNGATIRLTKAEGWHTCTISPDGKYFTDSYTSLKNPGITVYGKTDGKSALTEIFKAIDPSDALDYGEIEMGTIKSADGKYDNWYRLIKPLDFDESKKYPVILYVYGGPHTQLVTDAYQAQLRRWEMYMAQRGYVVFVMDNRGTPNHGAEYEKAIHRQCGQVEMQDQMKGMEWLMSHSWVDRDRIGVHGWSYGGFMTISLMTTYPDVFKVGVAGGPVIDWKWYEVMYGERYMETEATNPDGFALTSLIDKAPNLKGKLLICQGAIDNTVVWQHSLSFIESCIKNGVQVDYFPYPTHEHNVSGKDRVHLMQKVTDYFEDYLK
ncbi:MAG: S9 family peptidase [Bacteroidaceae bacterium]|nr:S9 family peptidase [Bacteroidaceae bacterium]